MSQFQLRSLHIIKIIFHHAHTTKIQTCQRLAAVVTATEAAAVAVQNTGAPSAAVAAVVAAVNKTATGVQKRKQVAERMAVMTTNRCVFFVDMCRVPDGVRACVCMFVFVSCVTMCECVCVCVCVCV